MKITLAEFLKLAESKVNDVTITDASTLINTRQSLESKLIDVYDSFENLNKSEANEAIEDFLGLQDVE